jgi:hypothetical protein
MLETEDRPLLGTAAGKEAWEGSSYFDDLATALADGSISRRQALKSIGVGALAFAIGPLFPEQAEALTRVQRLRCRRRGGLLVERGECHCTEQSLCADNAEIHCEGNPDCHCFKTVEKRGFCGRHGDCVPCTASAECPQGWRCVVHTCCTDEEDNPIPTCVRPCEAEEDPNLVAAPNAPASDGT